MLAFIHSFEKIRIQTKKIFNKKWLLKYKGPYVTLYDLQGQTSYYQKLSIFIYTKGSDICEKFEF